MQKTHSNQAPVARKLQLPVTNALALKNRTHIRVKPNMDVYGESKGLHETLMTHTSSSDSEMEHDQYHENGDLEQGFSLLSTNCSSLLQSQRSSSKVCCKPDPTHLSRPT